MFGNSALFTRLLFVCAAVMLFITSDVRCSDAARVGLIPTQMDNRVTYKVLRRLYTPHSHPLFTSTETGLQTKTNSKTETSGNYKAALSIIDHQSNPLWLTGGSNHQNNPDNRESRAGITGLQRGAMPESSYHPLSGNSYNSYPAIIRKSSETEAASPFHQSSSPTQDAQKSDIKENLPRNEFSPLFSSQTGRHQSAPLPTSRGHYSSYKDTNELAAVGERSPSRGLQSSKFLGFAAQTAPREPSISNSVHTSVIKSFPSTEKVTSSIKDFPEGLHSQSSIETARHKKVQSYLFKDSQASFGGQETANTVTGDGLGTFRKAPHEQRASNAQAYRKFSSNVKQKSERKDPTEEVQNLSVNANHLHHNANSQASFREQEKTFTDDRSGTFYAAPHEQRVSNARVYKKFPSNIRRQSQRKDPTEVVHNLSDNANHLYHQASFGGEENSVISDGQSAFYTAPHDQRTSNAQVYRKFSSTAKQLQQPERKDPSKKVQNHYAISQASLNGQQTANVVSGDTLGAFHPAPHEQRAFNAQVDSEFSSNVKQQFERKNPTKEVQKLSANANHLYHNANSQASFGEQGNTVTGDGLGTFHAPPQEQSASNAQFYRKFSSNVKGQSERKDPIEEVQSLSGNANQLYHNSDSQASLGGQERALHEQRALNENVNKKFSSNIKQLQQSERKDPTENVESISENANKLYHNANLAQYSSHTDSFPKSQQISAHLAPMKGTMQSFVPLPQKSVESSFNNTTIRGPTHAYRPAQTIKSIYGFRGFEIPKLKATKAPSIVSSDSRRSAYPSLSPRYSFGQREASTTPTKHAPSSGALDVVQIKSSPRFASGFKNRPLLPENDAGMDSKPDRKGYRVYRRIYGLKGFGTRPFEGAKTSVREPDVRVQQGFEGFKLRSSQIWQPKKSSHESATGGEDLKPLGSTRFTPEKYKERRKIYSFPGFQPLQNRNNKAHKENPTTASPRIAPYLRSAGDIKIQWKSEPRTPDKITPVAKKASLLNSATSSTVRGKRVRGNGKKLNESLTTDTRNAAIVRLPKRPARIRAFTYADILGSVSFSGVAAQKPITPADKDYSPNITTTKQDGEASNRTLKSEDAEISRNNTSKVPEAEDEDVEKNKSPVKSEETDKETFDLFLDNEGSGSGGFNMSDVFFSTDSTKTLSRPRLFSVLTQIFHLLFGAYTEGFSMLLVSELTRYEMEKPDCLLCLKVLKSY
ncbi:uncharacterized protein LOC121939023 [Plectropomus leopardus]|uniref:uncharacterized protein LOC121939023 n=1 Tax=Plectropomus leopardus TaxID=160734 RepID=UPI001C4BB489|nr:uncharacterized protein LOC121939023 [Plectropomus leopardus]